MALWAHWDNSQAGVVNYFLALHEQGKKNAVKELEVKVFVTKRGPPSHKINLPLCS